MLCCGSGIETRRLPSALASGLAGCGGVCAGFRDGAAGPAFGRAGRDTDGLDSVLPCSFCSWRLRRRGGTRPPFAGACRAAIALSASASRSACVCAGFAGGAAAGADRAAGLDTILGAGRGEVRGAGASAFGTSDAACGASRSIFTFARGPLVAAGRGDGAFDGSGRGGSGRRGAGRLRSPIGGMGIPRSSSLTGLLAGRVEDGSEGRACGGRGLFSLSDERSLSPKTRSTAASTGSTTLSSASSSASIFERIPLIRVKYL